uniref:Uncharacterized protein n=1 Tax=Ixodes ricinus TaxID=34613 RepID=A0A147BU88_IXORI
MPRFSCLSVAQSPIGPTSASSTCMHCSHQQGANARPPGRAGGLSRCLGCSCTLEVRKTPEHCRRWEARAECRTTETSPCRFHPVSNYRTALYRCCGRTRVDNHGSLQPRAVPTCRGCQHGAFVTSARNVANCWHGGACTLRCSAGTVFMRGVYASGKHTILLCFSRGLSCWQGPG